MRKIILFFVFVTSAMFAQDSTILISQFSLGSNEDELWFNSSWYGSGEAHCARSLAIYNNEIYIPNWVNGSNGWISIFSLAGEHLRNIMISSEDSRYLVNTKIFVNSGLIYCFPGSQDGLGIFDFSGNLIANIPNESYYIPAIERIIFPFEDSFLVLYDDKEPEIFTNEGISITYDNYMDILDNDNPINSMLIYENYLRESSIPFTNSRILENDLRSLRKIYFDYMQKIENQIISKNSIIENNNFSHFYQGSDHDGNLYWWSYRGGDEDYIVITNPIGEIVTIFENPIDQKKPAITPDGDLYFLNYTESKMELWKTERNW